MELGNVLEQAWFFIKNNGLSIIIAFLLFGILFYLRRLSKPRPRRAAFLIVNNLRPVARRRSWSGILTFFWKIFWPIRFALGLLGALFLGTVDYLNESNNNRAKFLLFAMFVATIVTFFLVVPMSAKYYSSHPAIKTALQEESGQHGESILKGGYLPDPNEFFNPEASVKKPVVKENEDQPKPWYIPSLFRLGVWSFVVLPLLWLCAFLYGLYSLREETLQGFKAILHEVKEIRARKSEVIRPEGRGFHLFGHGHEAVPKATVVLGSFSGAAATATANLAASDTAATEAEGKKKNLLMKFLAGGFVADEAIELIIKIVDFFIKRKKKQVGRSE